MKNVLQLMGTLWLCIITACNGDKGADEKINYIYLLDTIEQNDITRFEELFKKRINKDIKALDQYQPEGYANITFTVYLSSSFDLKPVAEISFRDNTKKKLRGKQIKEFLAALKPHMNSKVKDRYILRNLERVVTSLRDPNSSYEIILHSEMIENSGGAIRDGEHHEADFRFIDDITNGYFCNNKDFSAARQQLQDPNSWISKHLIKNGIPEKTRFTVCVKAPPRIDSKDNQECNFNRDFWQPLFSKMGFTPREESMEDYEYLAKID